MISRLTFWSILLLFAMAVATVAMVIQESAFEPKKCPKCPYLDD